VGLLACLVAGSAARATPFSLDVEFDDGVVGSFGTVELTELGDGSVLFEIALDAGALGGAPDLHRFYFNLPSVITGVEISSSDTVNTPYTLSAGRPVLGGAGSSFDYEVNFGSGAGPPGNGVLGSASFVVSADDALSIADFLVSSSTAQDIEVFFAAHVQGTDFGGSDSETVGTLVPEPSLPAYAAIALALAALSRRYRRSPA
jgi:hypothetical protein